MAKLVQLYDPHHFWSHPYDQSIPTPFEDLLCTLDIVVNPAYSGAIQDMLRSSKIYRLELANISYSAAQQHQEVYIKHRLNVVDFLRYIGIQGVTSETWHKKLYKEKWYTDKMGRDIQSAAYFERQWLGASVPTYGLDYFSVSLITLKQGLLQSNDGRHRGLKTISLEDAITIACNTGAHVDIFRENVLQLHATLEYGTFGLKN